MSLPVLALLLTGCLHRVPQPVGPLPPRAANAVELWSVALADPLPGPRRADVRVQLANGLSARGVLAVAPPDRLRLDVFGPIGGPVLVVVSDGTALRSWQAEGNRWTVIPDADREIAAVMAGTHGVDAPSSVADGLETLVRVLLGYAPQVAPTSGSPNGAVAWAGPRGSEVRARLDPGTARLAHVSAGVAGAAAPWMVIENTPGNLPEALPAQIIVTLPGRGPTTLSIEAWSPFTPDAAAFALTPPPGSEVRTMRLDAEGIGAP
jgi:hypothetical protein